MVIDLLVPYRCPVCRRPTSDALCRPCAGAAEALVLADHGSTRLASGIQALGLYAYDGVIRDAIRAMKAGGCHAAAVRLGAQLRGRLGLPPPSPGLALTWVPASRRRRRRRGVDIPELLAGPEAVRLLARTRERPDQTLLDPASRRASPLGSFRAGPGVPRAVVLFDDVRTTGATALAAGRALQNAGAQRVLVLTLAVAGSGQSGLV